MRLPVPVLLALFIPSLVFGDLTITSPDFAAGAAIPSRFTCQGRNISPALVIAGVPAGARSLVLIVDDPDAPSGTFTHWLIWNIPAGAGRLSPGGSPAGAVEGTNDFGNAGYSGPCPPSGTHRYFFRLSALDVPLRLGAGALRAELEGAMRGHVIGGAVLMGRYSKSGSH